MYSDDLLQRRLASTANRSHNETYQFAKEMSGEPYSLSDMYAFQNQLQDMSNTSWASSQYTQFKFGIRKAIIDAIN
ncbi:HrpF protein [Serratia rubidaea]|uniref:HrpF protein n=1 Tax=Serratia rubidaea TaxID=61652 RepID=A0A3S5F1N6_SERRU|nr:HrpF protein [Serratia rubidaea]MDC6117438.1 HrpF protein [Serratia rubidaea]VEI65355.1 HrpF protein [Serratia rubidaea]